MKRLILLPLLLSLSFSNIIKFETSKTNMSTANVYGDKSFSFKVFNGAFIELPKGRYSLAVLIKDTKEDCFGDLHPDDQVFGKYLSLPNEDDELVIKY